MDNLNAVQLEIVLLIGAALVGEFYPVPHIVAMLTEAIGAAAADSVVE